MDYEAILKVVKANVPSGDHYAISAQIYKALNAPKGPVLKPAPVQKRTRRTAEQMAAARSVDSHQDLHEAFKDAAE